MHETTKDGPKVSTADDHTQKPLIDTVVEGVEGVDEPMEDEHPSVPAVLALGAYPIILVIALVGALIFFFLF